MTSKKDYEDLVQNLRLWSNLLKCKVKNLEAIRELDYSINNIDPIISCAYEILGEEIAPQALSDVEILYLPNTNSHTADEVRVEYLKEDKLIDIIDAVVMALAKLAVVFAGNRELLKNKWIVERIATELNAELFKITLGAIPTDGEEYDREDDEIEPEGHY